MIKSSVTLMMLSYTDDVEQLTGLTAGRFFSEGGDGYMSIKKIAEKVKPDIIHLHSSKAGVIGRLAFDGKKTPLFYTPHGYSFLMQNYKPLKRLLFKSIETICAKRNCTTISCSPGEQEETLKLTKRAEYVNNGINLEELEKDLNDIEKEEHPSLYSLLDASAIRRTRSYSTWLRRVFRT